MSTSTDVSKHGGIRPRLQADCRHTESPQSASADWSSRLFKIKDLPSDRAGWRGFLRGRAEWFGLLRGIGGVSQYRKPSCQTGEAIVGVILHCERIRG